MIRYSLPMGKKEADFADVLTATIDRWYSSAEQFASVAGVSGASVSRWCRRVGRPTARLIEQMAPHIKDERGRTIPLRRLMDLVYPGEDVAAARVYHRPGHPLANELAKMLDADSPIPPEKREALTTLVDALIAPYRTFMRKRKTA